MSLSPLLSLSLTNIVMYLVSLVFVCVSTPYSPLYKKRMSLAIYGFTQ